ncbi:MAG: hypothetical protein A2452_05620 [Candidatus Firestonebacteria bacterium RIFOXYC2_FULL_39_67]|nr:MAG: hypothetical protein A2536_10450 [Candidatus Firestonebacteria bacterium RIFOXYD2_FULL_39_29]OGF51802.1 MAG: hypothetical protein A2497_08070 [Candidatus Firestonebacteria bacterium RifOxyC12_full_39_7]OGF56417.1 MAG: hypothetical protein A2452_05620 [Candidatus Firestonebacteria bacterium RIFOXYC2_FULL_39_67]
MSKEIIGEKSFHRNAIAIQKIIKTYTPAEKAADILENCNSETTENAENQEKNEYIQSKKREAVQCVSQ